MPTYKLLVISDVDGDLRLAAAAHHELMAKAHRRQPPNGDADPQALQCDMSRVNSNDSPDGQRQQNPRRLSLEAHRWGSLIGTAPRDMWGMADKALGEKAGTLAFPVSFDRVLILIQVDQPRP